MRPSRPSNVPLFAARAVRPLCPSGLWLALTLAAEFSLHPRQSRRNHLPCSTPRLGPIIFATVPSPIQMAPSPRFRARTATRA